VHLKGAEEMKPVAFINEEDGLVCAKCFKPFTKELSDDEIADLIEAVNEETGRCSVRIFDHTKVLLRKLKEKYERESKENN
jgi:hypothetical protein